MTIRKESNKTYTVDVSGGYSAVTGKQKRCIRKGIKTKKEAIALEQQIRLVEFDTNNFGIPINMDSLFKILIKEEKLQGKKRSYISVQEYNYNRHIRDYFKDTDVRKIVYDDIYNFREYLQQKSQKQNEQKTLTNNTINKIMILLKQIIDVGIRKGYYKENPSKLLKKLPTKKAGVNYWTIEEFKQFTSLFNEEEYPIELLFKILYLTGVRLGEAIALKWSDINFQNATLNVNKTAHREKGENIMVTPKTSNSNRIVALNPKLVDELKEWRSKQKELLSEFSLPSDDYQIIQNQPLEIGKHSIEKIYKQVLERDTNLKPIRIHDFRHSHASLLINNGEDYTIIKERLGHSSITTTIDTYSHLYPSTQREVANKLDSIF